MIFFFYLYQVGNKFVKENILQQIGKQAFMYHINQIIIFSLYYHIIAMIHKIYTQMCLPPRNIVPESKKPP